MPKSTQERYWIPHLVEEFQDLKENIPHDCYVLVGSEKIATHRTVVQVNSSLLTEIEYDPETKMFDIEIDPEFDDVEMISKIIQSFYCGKIDVEEDKLRSVYKFANVYSIKWMTKMLMPRFLEFIRKENIPERFVDIFTFSHRIWCKDLAEESIKILNLSAIQKLIEDHALTDELSYECMKTLTMSDNLVDIPEYHIFELLESWLKSKSQKLQSLPADYEKLAMNIRYHLIGKKFVIERFFGFSARIGNESVRSDLMMTIGKRMNESAEEDHCRFVMKKIVPVKVESGLEAEIRSLVASTSKNDVLMKETEAILTSSQLAATANIDKESLTKFIGKKQIAKHLSINGLFSFLNHHHRFKVLLMVIDKSVIHGSNSININFSYQITQHVEWTNITESTIMFIIDKWHNQTDPQYHEYVLTEITMLWCIANKEKCENVVKKYLNSICFTEFPDEYKSMILLPVLKNLSPGIEKLECSHEGKCRNKRSSCIVVIRLDRRVYLQEKFESGPYCKLNKRYSTFVTKIHYDSNSTLYARRYQDGDGRIYWTHPIIIFYAEVPFFPVSSYFHGNHYLNFVTNHTCKDKAFIMIMKGMNQG